MEPDSSAAGGRPLDGYDNRELRWVVAHELAHVWRRDHLVRWLEWVACVVFWWNPVAWWAHAIRADGEAISSSPRVQTWLEREGFTAEQIDFVIGLAKRLADRR